ncbi:hypothetical protein FRC08_001817 [Ceratobasidium sp. 394]|nr:hypothetical protein FRC08_001817 [Ceratobasidium sp. 394]
MVGGKRLTRSTISRTPPIAAARAKREQKPTRPSIVGENWGAGGDVAQELEVAIPEVGVRRRHAASDAQGHGAKSTPLSLDLSRMKARVECGAESRGRGGQGRGIDLVGVHISI